MFSEKASPRRSSALFKVPENEFKFGLQLFFEYKLNVIKTGKESSYESEKAFERCIISDLLN